MSHHSDGCTASTLLARICVQPPYYALGQLHCPTPGTVTADIPVQVPAAAGTITTAESMRHGAILGLCALASAAPDDQHRYYLATSGRSQWHHHRGATIPITGTATGTWNGKRQGQSDIRFTTGETTIMDLTIDYAVLTDGAFERLFGHLHRPDTNAPQPGTNPHIAGLNLENLTYDRRNATASATVTPTPEQCAGHFPNYPAAPLAMLLRATLDLASTVIGGGNATATWRPLDGYLPPVSRLVAAGEPVTLHAEIVHHTHRNRVVQVTMIEGGTQLGRVSYSDIPAASTNSHKTA